MTEYFCMCRGKRIDNKEWTEGYFFKSWERTFLLWGTSDGIPDMIEVIPETVGRCSELTDKDKKMVFEGDIGWDSHNECYGVVVFDEGKFLYHWDGICTDLFELVDNDDIDFVGNIHDNPELMGIPAANKFIELFTKHGYTVEPFGDSYIADNGTFCVPFTKATKTPEIAAISFASCDKEGIKKAYEHYNRIGYEVFSDWLNKMLKFNPCGGLNNHDCSFYEVESWLK